MNEAARWRRPGPTRTQLQRDAGLAAAVAAGGVVASILVNSMGAFTFDTAPSLAEQLAWMLALAAPLALRRRFPATVALAVSGLFIAAQARHIGDNVVPSLALFVAVYSVGAWGPDRVVARWVRVGVIVAMFGWLGVGMYRALAGPPIEFEDAAGPLDPLLANAIYGVGFNLLYFLAAYFFGSQAWESARQRHELEVQSVQLRHSQAENARQAVVAERLRIARDLHDVVAHHVSVMGVQAAAARRSLTRAADPDQATMAVTAVSAVEQTARTAMGELRGLLGVLRADRPDGVDRRNGDQRTDGDETSGAYPSAPGLDQLADLVEKTRATGLQVTHSGYGEARPVPDAVALSAYRVVQEALTNTVRHAAATTADVRVRFLDRALEVEVRDDGRGPANRPPAGSGTGLGLVGMRERVAVHGGELEVGPRREGGFQVRARFPLAPAPPDLATEE